MDDCETLQRLVDRAVDKAPAFKIRDVFLCLAVSFLLWVIVGVSVDHGMAWLGIPAAAAGVWSSWMAQYVFVYVMERG